MFISWLNFDIGLDVCFLGKNENSISNFNYNAQLQISKALIQLAFPAYVIVLVTILIVASECSSKFAKIICKGNPVAVLATMILLSYAKFLNAVFALFYMFYWVPAHGSRNVNVTRIQSVLTAAEETNNINLKAFAYFLLLVSILIILLCVIFAALVFSWQWLLQYQDKVMFKWMSYQKLHHFLEPYYAPYTTEY